MEFRIAYTFTDSLARLTGEEQRAVKTAAFDLQVNPASPGLSFHKIERAKDKNFWSVRASQDIRLIVHRTDSSVLLCYVDHHNKAYDWAERRKLETHPTTGAAQLVEVRERVEEFVIPRYIEEHSPAVPKPLLFADTPEADLLNYGVPVEWLTDVRSANEDSLFDLVDHLPQEAAEALLDLATGGTPAIRHMVSTAVSAFEHPDAQRRFRVVANMEELERALNFPWDKWTVFLHPMQKEIVERDFGGPVRISGSAGTGKTIVALHRAVFLARTHSDSRVLLTTFSEMLANALQTKFRRLAGNEPQIAERVDVHAVDVIARRLYEKNIGKPTIATPEDVRTLIAETSADMKLQRYSLSFLTSEWEDVVDAWQLSTWESYRDVARLGRKTRLPEKQRESLWALFSSVRAGLSASGQVTRSQLLSELATYLGGLAQRPYEFVVVDEAQDVSVAQLRFLAALSGGQDNGLFCAGDLGQRIFQQPFSWKTLGVDIRGRSKTLRVNYRTSHQIRASADRLLGPEVTDVDGNTENRRGTTSVFNGPQPEIVSVESTDEEAEYVGAWVQDRISGGVKPGEIGVFVRSMGQIERAAAAVELAGTPYRVLDDNVSTSSVHASISTMHLAKGLEFRAVVVMACDDEVLPLQERIECVVDDSDLEEVYNTERHLLYVACTRARDHLLVTGVAPASEFLDDLIGNS